MRSFRTPLTLCSCWGQHQLVRNHGSSAVVYDLIGKDLVQVDTYRCHGCDTIYGPTFKKVSGVAQNNVVVSQLALEDVLFLNVKVGFTIRYLKYHAHLLFRCVTSARGIEWSFQKTFFDVHHDQPRMGWEGNFRKLHYDALFYYMVSLEMELVGRHLQVRIGNELTEQNLALYDQHCHEQEFPPVCPRRVTAVVADGHQKVLIKCEGNAASKRAGRPRKDGHEKKRHGHGWFMILDPKSSRILCAIPQDKPEGNDIIKEALCKVLPLYPRVDCFIMDRACHFMPSAKKNADLQQLKYYIVDKFHAFRHQRSCKCHPRRKRLSERLGKLNTSIAEQTFSWFRSYAIVVNEMRRLRHHFLVLLFCKWHNQLVEEGNTQHLHPVAAQKKAKRKSTPYACKRRPASKAMKRRHTMKIMKAMKWEALCESSRYLSYYRWCSASFAYSLDRHLAERYKRRHCFLLSTSSGLLCPYLAPASKKNAEGKTHSINSSARSGLL